jgi:hypothetical protein
MFTYSGVVVRQVVGRSKLLSDGRPIGNGVLGGIQSECGLGDGEVALVMLKLPSQLAVGLLVSVEGYGEDEN